MNNINNIEFKNGIPKYVQIANTIAGKIQNKDMERGAFLPSLVELSEQYGVSRETSIAAYRELKALGIVKSSPRRGFYLVSENIKTKHKIFLYLDEMNGFKEVLYNGIKEGIGNKGSIEVYFHHFNASVYERTIRESIGYFTSYVIMPVPQKSYATVLKSVPENKLYILDIGLFPYGKKYPSVCQNFEKDIISTLSSGLDLIKKYRKLILVCPDGIQKQPGIIIGFNYFCKEHKIKHELIENTTYRKLKKGEAYIVIFDNDLVHLINSLRESKYILGKDIGIISYNDTPLKPIVANGITTISTDFKLMGLTIARMILNNKKDQIENPCYLIRRDSF